MRPHRQQPTRLRHPWDSPGKNTGVGCHFLLQCMKVKRESDSATPWTAAHQASPSMGFSRQEYWSGLPLPSPKHNARLLQISSTHLRKWLSFKIASSYFCCTNKRQMKRHLLSQPSLILFPVLHLCHHGSSAQHHPIVRFQLPSGIDQSLLAPLSQTLAYKRHLIMLVELNSVFNEQLPISAPRLTEWWRLLAVITPIRWKRHVYPRNDCVAMQSMALVGKTTHWSSQ